jgi:ATP-dependent Clp protease adapter protein ClpS
MPLPEEWDNINWEQTVVILPNPTEGFPTVAIAKHKYPQFPPGYYMMAFLDTNRNKVVGYNASDVGKGGKQLSEFVFWHELGHHALGHTGGLAPDQMEIAYSLNNELDADQYAFEHWIKKGTVYGAKVIIRVIEYFKSLGGAPGDAAHPPPADRASRLTNLFNARVLCKFIIRNDRSTSPVFVRDVLCQCFNLTIKRAEECINHIEQNGNAELLSKSWGQQDDRTARVIEKNEAEKIMHFIRAKKVFANQPAFTIECLPITV